MREVRYEVALQSKLQRNSRLFTLEFDTFLSEVESRPTPQEPRCIVSSTASSCEQRWTNPPALSARVCPTWLENARSRLANAEDLALLRAVGQLEVTLAANLSSIVMATVVREPFHLFR